MSEVDGNFESSSAGMYPESDDDSFSSTAASSNTFGKDAHVGIKDGQSGQDNAASPHHPRDNSDWNGAPHLDQKLPAVRKRQVSESGSDATQLSVDIAVATEQQTRASNIIKETSPGVYFGIVRHPDTLKWRNIVREFSSNYELYPSAPDNLDELVKAKLEPKGIRDFYICHDINGDPTKKRFGKNGICIATWSPASTKEILKKCKQRFRDDRKPAAEKRANEVARKSKERAKRVKVEPTSSRSKEERGDATQSSDDTSNAGGIVVFHETTINFQLENFKVLHVFSDNNDDMPVLDDKVCEGLLGGQEASRVLVCLGSDRQQGTISWFLVLQRAREGSITGEQVQPGQNCSPDHHPEEGSNDESNGNSSSKGGPGNTSSSGSGHQDTSGTSSPSPFSFCQWSLEASEIVDIWPPREGESNLDQEVPDLELQAPCVDGDQDDAHSVARAVPMSNFSNPITASMMETLENNSNRKRTSEPPAPCESNYGRPTGLDSDGDSVSAGAWHGSLAVDQDQCGQNPSLECHPNEGTTDASNGDSSSKGGQGNASAFVRGDQNMSGTSVRPLCQDSVEAENVDIWHRFPGADLLASDFQLQAPCVDENQHYAQIAPDLAMPNLPCQNNITETFDSNSNRLLASNPSASYERSNGISTVLEGDEDATYSVSLTFNPSCHRVVPDHRRFCRINPHLQESLDMEAFVAASVEEKSHINELTQKAERNVIFDDAEMLANVCMTTTPQDSNQSGSVSTASATTYSERAMHLLLFFKFQRLSTRLLRQIVLLSVVVLVSIVLAVNLSSDSRLKSSGPSTTTNGPGNNSTQTEDVKERDYLKCGVVENAGLSMEDSSTGTWSGFEVDLCRAVGAVIFGEDGHVSFTSTTYKDRFNLLQSGQVDLLAAGATYTMQRDLYEPTAKAGFTFSAPYLYNGVSFAGDPKFVACADQRFTTGNCTGIRICVQDDTTHVEIVNKSFTNSSVVILAPTRTDFYRKFVKGLCNVLAGEQFDLAQSNVIQAGYTGNYSIGTNIYSKEPISLVTRDDDAEWSDLVNWAFVALLTAETQSIPLETAQNIVNASSPGPAVDTSQLPFYRAVATVGNYAEMYKRHLESIVPRAPVNQQNNGTSPLIYSFPLGDSSSFNIGRVANGTLDKIRQRGVVRCGVGSDPFFSKFNKTSQQWNGLDALVCMAISAAIFDGIGSTQFIPVDSSERFAALANGTVDVLVRATGVNYERDVNETTTQKGFTFLPPIMYTGLRFGGILPYSNCANNLDVSSGKCPGLKICMNEYTTNIENARNLFPNRFIVPQPTEEAVYQCLGQNNSNAIGGVGIYKATVDGYYNGSRGSYQEGTKLFSRENLSPVTNQDDPEWSSFVTWVMHALYYAEEQGITQATYSEMPLVNLFGSSFTYMFQNIIQAVGSYGEIYNRSAESKYPRTDINKLHDNGPLHYPAPGLFGLY